MRTEKCPVCGKEMEDQRHVGVECFYNVQEAVPSARTSTIFKEVDAKGTYWGVTRRYKKGTKDKWVVTGRSVKNGVPHTRVDTKQVRVKGVRLLEDTLFSVTCCKSCRGDFLRLFRAWSRGEHVTPEGDGEVLVRDLGALKRISVAEWESRRAQMEHEEKSCGSVT